MRTAIAAIAAGALLALVGPLAPGAAAAGCVPLTNVEAIVDDSYSMETTDPNELRVQALDLLIDSLPATTTLGAIEFGSASPFFGKPAADPVFAPGPIGPNAAAMKGALGSLIKADNGATDYNGAFALSDAENPTAQARIFLTDGAHNEGAYANGHLVHRVPTYVIGFGDGLGDATDQARLERIAGDTGGADFTLSGAGQLQPVMNVIGAQLTCREAPRAFTDRLAAGRSAVHAVPIAAGTGSVQIALTWASPLDRFRLGGLTLVRGGKAVALKVERHGSRTFALIEVSGLGRGILRFEVGAAKVESGRPRVSITTQVTQQRR